jgi:hypothetical protein
MFTVDENERVLQMIPGQGWRLVIAHDPGELESGEPQVVEEPIIAWAIVQMNERLDFCEGDKIQQLVPIIRDTYARGYIWEFSEWRDMGTVLLAPGEERTPNHDQRALARQKKVADRRERKHAKWDEARRLRQEGLSFEAIAEKLSLSSVAARALALQADEAMRREKK